MDYSGRIKKDSGLTADFADGADWERMDLNASNPTLHLPGELADFFTHPFICALCAICGQKFPIRLSCLSCVSWANKAKFRVSSSEFRVAGFDGCICGQKTSPRPPLPPVKKSICVHLRHLRLKIRFLGLPR